MPITVETICDWLQQYGWTYETRDEALIVTGFRGASNAFRIFIQPAERSLILAIVPYVAPPTPESRDRFCRYLMRLNYELNLAKIGVDPDGDVALSVELPGEGISYEAFATVLDALCFYADENYLTLLNLGQDAAYQPDENLDVWGESTS